MDRPPKCFYHNPMTFLSLVITLIVSYLSVLAQEQFPILNQWILIYFTVFVVSWFGGMLNGMIASAFSLSLGGYILIPHDQFSYHHFLEIIVLMSLGFWISFSMDQYKKSRIKLNASEELEKSRGFLDTLLENIPMMVFVKEVESLRFVRFNKAGLDLLGFELEDLIGKNDFDIFPEDQANYFTQKDRDVLKDGGVLDIPFETADTRYKGRRILHTRKIPIMDTQGKPLYLLGVSEDITEKIKAEEFKIKSFAEDAAKMERMRIQERESFVANAISSLSITLDYQETLYRLVTIVVPSLGDWSILTIRNEGGQYERVASFHADPTLQPLLNEFCTHFPPDAKDVEVMRAFENGEAFLYRSLDDELLKLRSQNQRKFELYKTLGTGSSIIIPVKFRGKILGALSIIRGKEREAFDELDLVLAEEIGRRAGTVLENSQLFKSTQKAVRARDEFLSIASHELKTPITSLKLQLQILQRQNENANIEKPLRNAVGQIDRLTLLVNDLLDVSKFESGKMSYNFQNFLIGELVNEVLENLKNDFIISGSTLEVSISGDIEIEGDKYRLEQVLVNLVNNALKYGLGKPIHVTIEPLVDKVAISIKDHGKGIPAEFQKKIFDKFERGRQDSNISGLGLGLFISKEIVTAHYGQIELHSQIDRGTEFRMILPLRIQKS
jgi:PAS domain S-box-containing protein